MSTEVERLHAKLTAELKSNARLNAALNAALAELAQVTQWHAEVRQECAELRGGVGAIKAAALREASMALISGNGHELTIGATSRSHVAANARRWLRDRADAMTATTVDIGDGTSEGDDHE